MSLDPLIVEVKRAIAEAPGVRVVSLVSLQESPLLVSVDGVGSVPAKTLDGSVFDLGTQRYGLTAPTLAAPIVLAGAAGGGGLQGLFGSGVDQSGANSNAGGLNTAATGDNSVALGNGSIAAGENSVAEGGSTANGTAAHAEGRDTVASGDASHAEGRDTLAQGDYSHAEGHQPRANGVGSHAEGFDVIADGDYSHAEGDNTQSNGDASHAEGSVTRADGAAAHAEGDHTMASGDNAHAEGSHTTASEESAHAEGAYTVASGSSAHAEGDFTHATGPGAHAQGTDTYAIGQYSHAAGWSCVAFRDNEVSNGVPNGARTLQRTEVPLSGSWGADNVNLNYGTDPVTLAVHNGYFEGTVTLYSDDLADKWVIQIYGNNDAADYATRGTGTVTILNTTGGGATVYGSSPITWDVSGDSLGNVLITPSASIGGSDLLGRLGALELIELHEYYTL